MPRTVVASLALLTLAGTAAAQEPAFEVRTHRIGERVVERARPLLGGVPVEGADRVSLDGRLLRPAPSLAPLNAFVVDEAHAVAAACAEVRGCLFRDPTVEDTAGFGRAVWLARKHGVLATWRVRVPTWRLEDVRDVWIDAATGELVRSQPVVKLQVGEGEGEGEGEPGGPAPTAAQLFPGDQPSGPDADLEDELTLGALDGLLPLGLGQNLIGEHFETANCCKHYLCNDATQTCLDDLPPGGLARDVATCAEADTPGAITSVINLAIPTASLPFDLSQIGFDGDTLYAQVAFCAELPRARSLAGTGPTGEDGWFADPVDAERLEGRRPCGSPDPNAGQADLAGCAAEEDAFAEVAAYHASWEFFQHVRAIFDDTFCLEEQSMRCDADGHSLDDAGNPVAGTARAALPFHIAVNMMIPEIDLQSMAIQITPIGGSRGRSEENPIIIDDFQRIPNAAFIPALEGGPINIPPEFQALAALFSRPFDSNTYFQGFRDFAYDGDIVRHEFTHGIIHTLNPQLGSNGADDWGSHVEPGALNEGWADYFSASYANDPEMGEYASEGLTEGGETGLRNNDNDKRCPESLIGEVHADSEPWAGALWSIRATLGGDAAKVEGLERAALEAIAVSAPDEDFGAASAALVAAVRAESTLGDAVADAAQAELDARGLADCARILTLSTADDEGAFDATPIAQLNQPGKSDLGLTNYAPGIVQLRVQVPPGSGGFTLTWAQGAGGLAGVMGGGGDPEPMSVLVVEGEERITWTYEGSGGSLATPTNAAGEEIDFDASAAASQATIGEANQTTGLADASFTYTLESDPCNVRSFVVQIVSPAGGANLTNIDAENLATESECEVEPPPGVDDCDCDHTSGRGAPVALAGLALVGALLRRRRR